MLLVSSMIGWGCSDATSGPQPESANELPNADKTAEQSIDGGSIDRQNTAVVGMQVGRSMCTGTLIAKNLVLTARHCVSELSSTRVACGSSTFQGKKSKGNIGVTTDTRIDRNASFYGVERIHVPSGNDVCGKDIALLRLRSNVPSSEATPRKPRLQSDVSRATDYTAIGYGDTGDSSGRAGVRRILENRDVRALGPASRSGQTLLAAEDFAGSGGTCRGDSGGGAYDSQGRVAGVLSRGGNTRENKCASSIYTDVYDWRQWIQKKAGEAAQSGGYPAPSWTDGPEDSDDDGVPDESDNCPNTSNSDQKDIDGDGQGDACDSDIDADGVDNGNDNCPKVSNPGQQDLDNDGRGDACDEDIDGDGVENNSDNCTKTPNPDQTITHGDGDGDACDPDDDGDGIDDDQDNCPKMENPDQTDSDNDGVGDACNADDSNDGDNDNDGGNNDGGNNDGSDNDGDGTNDGSSSGDSGDDDTVVVVDKQNQSQQTDHSPSHACSASTTGSTRPVDLAGSLLLALLVFGSSRLRRWG